MSCRFLPKEGGEARARARARAAEWDSMSACLLLLYYTGKDRRSGKSKTRFAVTGLERGKWASAMLVGLADRHGMIVWLTVAGLGSVQPVAVWYIPLILACPLPIAHCPSHNRECKQPRPNALSA